MKLRIHEYPTGRLYMAQWGPVGPWWRSVRCDRVPFRDGDPAKVLAHDYNELKACQNCRYRMYRALNLDCAWIHSFEERT